MTQPPDDRLPPPIEPEQPTESEHTPEPAQPADGHHAGVPSAAESTTPANAPTVAWTPPDPGAPTPQPAEPAPAPSPTPQQWQPPTEPASTPPSPIISADASPPPAPGWQVPGAPPPASSAPGGGWEIPTAAAGPAVQREGYVVGSVGARFVAWLIDSLLAFIVPGALFLLLFDWAGFFQNMLGQMQFDASGRLIPGSTYSYTLPITLDVVLLYLILVGVQFLYFVGFWTSRWQATPGMIGLKMRVVDANTGAGLTLLQAAKRWLAMGWWLSLLVLVPPLQNAGSLAQFAVNLFLFFSVVTNDRKQGLHDKFAGSQVIRSVTSGSGATVVGCLAYGVMVILIAIAAGFALFAIAGPTFIDWARELPRYRP
jgi:uncharacterized RDD family membrane protein YckC